MNELFISNIPVLMCLLDCVFHFSLWKNNVGYGTVNEHSEQDEPEVEIHDPTSATDGRVQVLAESLGRRILRLCLYQDNFILNWHSIYFTL